MAKSRGVHGMAAISAMVLADLSKVRKSETHTGTEVIDNRNRVSG